MAEVRSIEAFRKRKKRKSLLKKGLIVLLLAAIAIGAWLSSKALMGKRQEDFSLSLKGEKTLRVRAMGNSGAVLTNAGISIYDASGAAQKKILHGFTNPVMRSSGNRLLCYDRGGTDLRIDTVNGNSAELTLQDPILTAQISSSGLVAVSTEDERYACRVTVYDANLHQELYCYYGTEVLTALTFSEDSQRLYGAAAVTVEGIVSTELYTLDLQQETVTDPILLIDLLPVSLYWSEGDCLHVVGDRALISYDCKKGTQTAYTYRGNLLYTFPCSTNEFLLATRSPFSSYTDLTVFSPNGTMLSTRTLQEEAVGLSGDGDRIVVLGKKAVSIFDMTLHPVDTISLPHSMTGIALSGARLWVLGNNSLEGYHLP